MKYLLLALIALISPTSAEGADVISGDNFTGTRFLTDSLGRKWLADVCYKTDGAGGVGPLGFDGTPTDSIAGDNFTGRRFLTAADGKKWQARICYTTDGAGTVIPIPSSTGQTVVLLDSTLTGAQIRAAGTTPHTLVAATTGKKIMVLSANVIITPDATPANIFVRTSAAQTLVVGDPDSYGLLNGSTALIAAVNTNITYTSTDVLRIDMPLDALHAQLVSGTPEPAMPGGGTTNPGNLGLVDKLSLYMGEPWYNNTKNGGLTGGGTTTLRFLIAYVLVTI